MSSHTIESGTQFSNPIQGHALENCRYCCSVDMQARLAGLPLHLNCFIFRIAIGMGII